MLLYACGGGPRGSATDSCDADQDPFQVRPEDATQIVKRINVIAVATGDELKGNGVNEIGRKSHLP